MKWNKRPVKRVTDTCVIHRWKSKDTPLVVDRITSSLGLPKRIILVQLSDSKEMILERGFRKVATAQKAAEKYV